jgi:uncharacterized protein (DUF1697 family)
MPAKASCARIALLRGINVGGHNKVAMSDLRALCEKLDLADVKTVLQSGNLVFRCDRQDDAALETLLETETAKRLSVSADFIVRSGDELARVVARNPFPKEAKNDPSHLLVMFLKAAPGAKVVETLRAGIKGRETVTADGKQLYIVYPDGIGRSKLTGTLIERNLGTKGTARNWNTILKLLALCE